MIDTLGKALELGREGDLEGLVTLRNRLTAQIRRGRQVMKERGALMGLDSKVYKEFHFERNVVRDYISQVRRKGYVYRE